MSRPNYYKAEVTVSLAPGQTARAELECFDLIDALCPGDFYLGNALKYLFRAGRKPGAEREDDLRKARTYVDQALRRTAP